MIHFSVTLVIVIVTIISFVAFQMKTERRAAVPCKDHKGGQWYRFLPMA